MPYLKMLGSTVLAATALLICVGGGTATADSFCRDSINPCLEGYEVGTPFSATTKTAVLKGFGFEVVCASTLAGKSTSYLEEGKGVTGMITSLTFSGCVGSCATSSATGVPYSLLALASKEGNGTATLSSGGEGNPGLILTACTATKQNCTYSVSELPLEFLGGKGGSEAADPQLIANGAKLTGTSGPCPAAATMTAKYITNKVGIQTNASWWWWKSEPEVKWEDYDFGNVKAASTASSTRPIKAKHEHTYGQAILTGNGESVFAIGVDNCSNQTILGICNVEVSCTPKKAGPLYEATLEIPWKEAKGEGSGTVKLRLKCTGT